MPGIEAGEDADDATEMPGLPSAFPWREAPDDMMNFRGLVERFMHSAMQLQHRRFFATASKLGDADTATDDEAFLVRKERERTEISNNAVV